MAEFPISLLLTLLLPDEPLTSPLPALLTAVPADAAVDPLDRLSGAPCEERACAAPSAGLPRLRRTVTGEPKTGFGMREELVRRTVVGRCLGVGISVSESRVC